MPDRKELFGRDEDARLLEKISRKAGLAQHCGNGDAVDKAMFTHMGGTWGKTQELATIKGGGIWYKKAAVYVLASASTDQNG